MFDDDNDNARYLVETKKRFILKIDFNVELIRLIYSQRIDHADPSLGDAPLVFQKMVL